MSKTVIMSASVINELGVEISTDRDTDMTHIQCIISATGLVFDDMTMYSTEYSVYDRRGLAGGYGCSYRYAGGVPMLRPSDIQYLTILSSAYRRPDHTIRGRLRVLMLDRQQ